MNKTTNMPMLREFFKTDDVVLVYSFEVAYVGWELDNNWSIVMVKGKTKVMTTEHGYLKESNKKALEGHILNLEAMAERAKRGMDYFTGKIGKER